MNRDTASSGNARYRPRTFTFVRTLSITDTDGHLWRVRVVWQPRWRALARRFGGWRRKRRTKPGPGGWDVPNFGDGGNGGGGGGHHLGGGGGGGGSLPGDDLVVVVIVVVGMIAFGVLFWWVLLPLLLLLVDGVVVIGLAALVIPARVLLGRPWVVEATSGDHRVTRHVVGWRRALEARDDLAAKLAAGYPHASLDNGSAEPGATVRP